MESARKFSTPLAHAGWSKGRVDARHSKAIAARAVTPKVLFVDDEPQVVAGLRRSLCDYPYQVHTATSAELALQKLCEEPFDVIVADECMPGMPGSELLTIIAHEFPLTGRILLTGKGTISAAARAVNEAGVVRVLLKPCPVTDLRDAIEAALNGLPVEQKGSAGNGRRSYLVSGQRPDSDKHGHDAAAVGDGRRQQLTLRRHKQWEANELVLHAQKVAELGARTLYGYELSTRLQAQAGDSHTVGNFVGSSGQHVPLSSVDRWVLRHVFKIVREHRQQLVQGGLTVSLNIAAQSLADPEFVRFLDQEVLDAGVPERVLIELREAALTKSLRKDEGLIGKLLALKCYESGTRLCIDGASGALWMLPVFRNLPIALAKIDGEIVGNVLASEQPRNAVRAAVSWGEQAGVAIAAMGVDTPAISECLRNLGVRYGQGEIFGGAEPVGLTLTNSHR
jgi:EAL domain-containing protein (putative c-di-GMP-specific phosphodiesterase class I)/DNA-binding NarL/FixJ family response regulator